MQHPANGGGPCAVTFTLPTNGCNGHRAGVVGDFNDWDPAATPRSLEGYDRVTVAVHHQGRHRNA